MSDINSVVIVGRVTQTPKLKYLSSGTAVLDLGIANNTYQGQSKGEIVNWLNVTVFGKRAESCEKYLDKGSQVVIQGKLNYQSWETKDGQKRNTVKIIADTVQFIGGKKNNNQDQQPAEQQSQGQSQPETSQPEGNSTTTDQQGPNDEEKLPPETPGESFMDDTDDIPF